MTTTQTPPTAAERLSAAVEQVRKLQEVLEIDYIKGTSDSIIASTENVVNAIGNLLEVASDTVSSYEDMERENLAYEVTIRDLEQEKLEVEAELEECKQKLRDLEKGNVNP